MVSFPFLSTLNILFIASDEQTKRALKSPTPSQLRVSTHCETADDLDPVGNQESIVKIMVESPKTPPNVEYEFGVAFPQTAVVRKKTESIQQEIEQTDDQTSLASVTLVTDNIQEPIDVNIPRDTTNIFYAYEETEVDNSFQSQSPQPLPPQPQSQSPQSQQQQQQSQQPLDSLRASTSEIDTSHTILNNQLVNIVNDDTIAPSETNQSDNQPTNQISSDNSKSTSS